MMSRRGSGTMAAVKQEKEKKGFTSSDGQSFAESRVQKRLPPAS